VALGDVDSDGDLDAFLGKGNRLGTEPSEFWLNDGQGNFQRGQRINDYSVDGVLADVDSDGDLDAVTARPSEPSKLLLNNGAGEFTDSGQSLAPNWSFDVAVGDVDGDGDVDVYYARGVDSPIDLLYLNDGQGNFSDSGQRLDGSQGGGVWLGDLDGDGDLDAYVANGNVSGGVRNEPDRVYLNDGTGKFTDSGQRLGTSLSRKVELADLDGDVDLDAFVTNGVIRDGNVVEQANEVWLNDGTGVFTAGQELGNAVNNGVALGDIDGDGDVDALVGNNGQDNHLWINTQPIAGDANRDGAFNQLDIVQILQSAKYQTGQPATWTEGDFNGDGVFDQLDIVAALQTGEYAPITNGPEQYEVSVVMTGLAAPRGLTIGPDGGLYVSETGSGGSQLAYEVERPEGPVEIFYGPSAAVSRLLNGVQERILDALPSLASPDGSTALQDIAFNSAGELFGVMGLGGTPTHRAEIGAAGESFGQLVRVPLGNGPELEPMTDLVAYEASANPDGREINSNPFDLIVTSTGFVVADAGANALVNVTAAGDISTLAVLPTRPNPLPFGPPVFESVPTAVALGPDNAYYVGELTGFPFLQGAANVYRLDPLTNEVSIAYSGFTNIVDVTFDNEGNLFVLQISTNGLASPTGPGPGQLIKIEAGTGERTTIVSDGLNFPGKVVAAPDGSLYVSNMTTSPSGGEVLHISPVSTIDR
jgi:hypothetical protein